MRSRERLSVDCGGVSRTKQSMRDETDINLIIKRHGGIPPAQHPGRFVDVSMVGDYFQSVQLVARAQQAFEQMPAVVRARFHNDPRFMVSVVDNAIADPESSREVIDELVKLDILAPDVRELLGIADEPALAPAAVPNVAPEAPKPE